MYKDFAPQFIYCGGNVIISGMASLVFIDDVTHDDSSRMKSEVYKTICLAFYRKMHPNLSGEI